MKPQILRIDGINSFNEMQEIDFSKVLDCGIFGILGDTGSGKSTIIDAITLALYGKIVRYNGDNKNGEFINLNRTEAGVTLLFSMKDGKDEILYEVIRRFKKNPKGDIKTAMVRLSILSGEDTQIISDKKRDIDSKIVEIVGLSYEDFTRAVVLPQGKFSEFLMLESKEKRKMLQRIFGLEKYGDKLKDKINEKKNSKEKIVNNLKLQLDTIGDIAENFIEDMENSLKEKNAILKTKTEEVRKLREEEQILNKFYELKKGYDEYDLKIKELLQYEHKFEEFKTVLALAEEVDKIFYYIQEKENLLKKSEELNNIILEKENNFKKICTNFNIAEEKLEEFKEKNNSYIPELERLEKNILEYISIEEEIEKKEKNIIDIKEQKLNICIEKEKITKSLKDAEESSNKLKEKARSLFKFNEENRLNLNLKEKLKNALEIKNAISGIEENIKNIENSSLELDNIHSEYIHKKENKEEEIKKLNIDIKKYMSCNKLNFEREIRKNKVFIENIDDEIKQINQDIKNLDMQIKLQDNNSFMLELAQNLTEGESCPLCGSKVHPEIFKIVANTLEQNLGDKKANLENKINENQNAITKYKMKNKILSKVIEDIERFAIKYDISEFNIIEDEFILSENEILNKIYSLNEEITNLNKLYENININLKNILDNKSQKEKQLKEENKKLSDVNLMYKALELENSDDILEESVLKEKYNYILNLEKIIEENSKKIFDITNNLEENDKIVTQEKNKLEEITRKEKNLDFTLTEASIYIEELNNRKNIDNIKNPKEKLEEIRDEISSIKILEEKIRKYYEEISLEKEKIAKELDENKIKQKLNEDALLTKINYIKNFLDTSSFTDENHIKASYKTDEEKEFYKEKIHSYTQKMSDYKINFNRFKIEIEKTKISLDGVSLIDIENKLNLERGRLEKYEKEEKIIIEEVAKLKFDIDKNKEKLERTKTIKETLEKEQKHLDILKELFDINKGGVFVEYVANRQLKHIVLDASKRLSSMSQEKYSLELIDNNFYIRDNYNAGIIRSPKSLSGGELFMTSLSLALALSGNIQLKNKSPLEVFFLDEGFGTLDISTIDIVINTLEQLQNNNISVGIITHVEEIKNRVQNKILVSSTDTGAKIKIV